MADGSPQANRQVKVSDMVVATDPTTGKTAVRAVTALIVGSGTNLVEITVHTDGDEGDRTGKLTATDMHPFWVSSEGRSVDAKDLKPGYVFETADHRPASLVAVRKWSEQQRVHNLTVDKLHTYYVVAGTTPVLVHNCGETYYRTMSQDHFDVLGSTGLSATRETFVSPTQAFSKTCEGVLVKFTVRKGTTAALEAIGVLNASAATARRYPDMPLVSRGWRNTSAFFKGEGTDHINIGLGGGDALDIFNEAITGFERIR